MKFTSALAGLIMLGAMGSAALADDRGFYVSAHGGWSFPENIDSSFASPGLPGGKGYFEFSPDDGYRAGGAFGYIFSQYFRGELELSYSRQDIDRLRVLSFPTGGAFSPWADAKGSASALSGMANAYLTLPTDTIFTPFVGAGIGYTKVSANTIGAAGVPGYTDDSDGAFTWQLFAGANYEVSRDLELGTRYRYQQVDDLVLYASNGDRQDIDKVGAHSLEFTLTWKLTSDDKRAPLK